MLHHTGAVAIVRGKTAEASCDEIIYRQFIIRIRGAMPDPHTRVEIRIGRGGLRAVRSRRRYF